MRQFSYAVSLVASVCCLSALVDAQCINNVAAYNPNVRTMSANSTWFIVPVPKDAVQTALNQAFPLGGLTLLDVPSSDTSLFPNGFPAGMQPVLANIAYSSDIRMSALQIDGPLISSNIYATYVGKGSSKTPISASLNGYIAGENGPLPNGLVPSVASPLLFAGAPIRLGQFIPQAAAYQSDAGGSLSAAVKWAVVPNPISGPGVYPEAVDMLFQTTASSKYTAKTFKTVINQPNILPSGMCQRNTYYFNNATALPAFRNGQVTLGPGASGTMLTESALMKASPDGSGVYANVDGYSACAQNVGNNAEDCEAAAANVDPAALN